MYVITASEDHVLMEVYLKLLGDPYWRGQALDAILVWYVLRQ